MVYRDLLFTLNKYNIDVLKEISSNLNIKSYIVFNKVGTFKYINEYQLKNNDEIIVTMNPNEKYIIKEPRYKHIIYDGV